MTNSHDDLEITQDGRILEVALNRPERRNALSTTMLRGLITVLQQADRDSTVSVVLVRANGSCFSVGADLGGGEGSWDLGGLSATPRPRSWPSGLPEHASVGDFIETNRQANVEFYDAYLSYLDLAKPVVCFVHGWCMGAGAWFACAADLTIAADDAVFGQPEVRQGEAFDAYWTFLAGPKHALRYGLTGDHFSADEAARIGLVTEVVPKSEGLERARQLTRRVAAVPLDALRYNKLAVRRAMDLMGVRNALLLARETGTLLSSSVREEPHHRLEAAAEGGTAAFFRERDAEFWPEPFGPRSGGR